VATNTFGGRRLAGALRRLAAPDRGASAVEVAILAPALIFVSMLVVEFGLWFDATHAALAAAQEGDRVARETESGNAGWQSLAGKTALDYYDGLDTSVLSRVSVSRVKFDAATSTVSLTVSGTLRGVFPLTVSQTVSGPVECFRASGDEGATCAQSLGG
jgi:Flp pilus assembly protein TadG